MNRELLRKAGGRDIFVTLEKGVRLPKLGRFGIASSAKELRLKTISWRGHGEVAAGVDTPSGAKALASLVVPDVIVPVWKDVPAEPPWPSAAYVQLDESLLPAGEVYAMQARPRGSTGLWDNALAGNEPGVFSYHNRLRTWGFREEWVDMEWRCVRVPRM